MELLKIMAPLAWRNLWRNSRRTLITLIVVAAGVYSVLMFAALMEAWAASARDRAQSLLTGSGQIHATGYLEDPTIDRRFPDPDGAFLDALNSNDILAWAPRLNLPAVIQSEYKTLPVSLIGIDPKAERALSDIPDHVVSGRFLETVDEGGIVLGAALLDRLKTQLGRRVILLAQDANGKLAERSFDVVGVYDDIPELEDQTVFVGLNTARNMLATGETLTEIAYRVHDDADADAVLARLQAAAPDLDIRRWQDLSPMAAMMDEMMGTMVYVWLAVMFVLMAFGIVNTQLMAVFERVREFGLLQALGMRPRAILVLVTLESIILVGVGCVIGFVGALATLHFLQGGIDISFLAEGAAMAGAGQVLYPQSNPRQFVELAALIWLLGVLVALWPARKAARSNPVEAMTHVS